MATGELTATDRMVNTLLLVALALLGLSGIVMLYGTWLPWVFDLHRAVGWSLVALLPWKGITIYRSLQRGMSSQFDRNVVLFISLILAHFIALIIILGVMWMWRIGPYESLLQTLVAWHWILGLAVTPPLAVHVWRRWPRPRREEFITRRGFLSVAGVTGLGVVAGGLATRLAEVRATQERPRRPVTGSRGFGHFTGNDFPVIGEGTPELDVASWRLVVSGAVVNPLSLSYPEILARRPSRQIETLDCTSGWFSVQEWEGVALAEILEGAGLREDAAGVRLISATQYNHSYPLAEARRILLATHVTGQVLAPRHGYPLRAVVPGRRGWFWVKWLAEIEVVDNALEVFGGILWSPRQVLRQWG